MELSRKLRPEFSKIFVTSDFNEALNLVSGIRARDGHDVDLVRAMIHTLRYSLLLLNWRGLSSVWVLNI